MNGHVNFATRATRTIKKLRVKDNDKKTRFYTGLPVYGVFVALLTYLQMKAVKLRKWRGEHETSA